MKVKLNTARVGHTKRGGMYVQSIGDVVEVPQAEGERMLDRGQATLAPKGAKSEDSTKE